MRKEKCFIFIACMLGSITAQTFTVDECTTPKNESGVCIHLTSCPILLKVLNHRIKTKSDDDLNFLRTSHCGFDGRQAKVCCPLKEISPDSLGMEEIVNENEEPTTDGDALSSGSSSESTCGKIAVNRDKIVGGKNAELGYWPWIAALGYKHVSRQGDIIMDQPLQWLCAGTLITDRHVLTAAHCVNFSLSHSLLVAVRLGELDLNPDVKDGANPIDTHVERSIVHPDYNTLEKTNDIAILKLNQSVTYNNYIQPICLLSALEMNNVNLERSMPYAVGWGSVNDNPQQDKKSAPNTALMEVQVPIVNATVCKQNYANQRNVIDERVICAGYQKGGKDSCRGDSGGPLILPKKSQYFLLGVVSYGKRECGQPNSPGVYTRVSSYVDWIKNTINAS